MNLNFLLNFPIIKIDDSDRISNFVFPVKAVKDKGYVYKVEIKFYIKILIKCKIQYLNTLIFILLLSELGF